MKTLYAKTLLTPSSCQKLLWIAAWLLCYAAGFASSHREAPIIANDPAADLTDVYAFVSPDDPEKVTMIMNVYPFERANGGPNYYNFDPNVTYQLNIKNDPQNLFDDIMYRFTFQTASEDPTTFFNIRLGQQNLKTTYTVEKSTDGGNVFSTILTSGIVPPNNIGPRSIESSTGLNTTYQQLIDQAIASATTGEKIYAGPADDPFFVDLGGIFDLGNAPRQNDDPKDALKGMNVHSIALQIPISALQKDGKTASQATSILDADFVIGVWASTYRRQIQTLEPDGASPTQTGQLVQVSRLGNPLVNEVITPIGEKDQFNAIEPYFLGPDQFKFFANPELALYMDDDQFGSAVPAFAPLRIQRNSLQAFDFGFGQDGLWPLKGMPALDGTVLAQNSFGDFYLPGPGQPRSVDLGAILTTGIPNERPYQLATGKNGDPFAAGKPFINNFLPIGDYLRLNMATPPTPRDDPDFSSLGLIQAAVLGLTDSRFNTNTNLEFIPNMDGFPNGRRLEDDVTRIELQAVSGVVLAAIGLWYDDFDPTNSTNPVTQDLLDVLGYSTGVEANDVPYRSTFPYIGLPHRGTEQ